MKMKLNRDHVLRHESGVSVRFTPGMPAYIPPRLVAAALELGAEPAADGDVDQVEAVKQQLAAAGDEAARRAPAIEEAVRKMLARNQRGDFTAAGRPNLNVLFRLTGIEVSAKELEPIWAKVVKDIE